MFLKKYEFINSLNVIEKKILIKNEYLKYWIRRIKSKNFKNSYLIDNSFTYVAIKKTGALLNTKLGNALTLSNFKFKNKFNKNIQFQMPSSIKNEFEHKLENLKTKKHHLAQACSSMAQSASRKQLNAGVRCSLNTTTVWEQSGNTTRAPPACKRIRR